MVKEVEKYVDVPTVATALEQGTYFVIVEVRVVVS